MVEYIFEDILKPLLRINLLKYSRQNPKLDSTQCELCSHESLYFVNIIVYLFMRFGLVFNITQSRKYKESLINKT